MTPAAADLLKEHPERGVDGAPGVNGLLLHTIEVGPRHKVEFFKFGDGLAGIRETFVADGATTPVLGSAAKPTTLAATFRQLQPTSPVPGTLIEMDRLVAKYRKDHPRRPIPAPRIGPPRNLSDDASSTSRVRAAGSAASMATASDSCSSDQLGDGWSGAGFIGEHCINDPSGYSTSACDGNLGWIDYAPRQSMWLDYWQMEGDFNVAGHSKGWYWECWYAPGIYYWLMDPICLWAPLWDEVIGPREVVHGYFLWDGWIRASGTSPCGHLHVAHNHH